MTPPDSPSSDSRPGHPSALAAMPVAPAAWSQGVLGWGAWQRLLAVAPLLLLLWLAVAWALPEAAALP